MASLLDVLGATVIGGFVIFMLIQLNARIMTSSSDLLAGTITQRNAAISAQIIEHYVYKVGYKSTSNKISIADSNKIKFHGDIDNDSVVDTVEFYSDTQNDLDETENPNDFGLYRKENNGAALITAVVSQFKLTYYDSLGKKLNYALLSNQSIRDKIRSIGFLIEFESPFPVDSSYQGVSWKRTITPKNISSL